MSSLTAIFGNSADKSADSDKLLDLYWNRNELKKEFAGMRKEMFRLQDKIKQQDGASARIQQKLQYIEDLLLDPEAARSVLAFYQLRGLGLRCQRKLARFAEQLKQQREQKQHNNVLAGWNEQRAREAKAIEERLFEKRDVIMQLEDQVQSERRRLVEMNGFFRLFRRRRVTAILDGLTEQLQFEEGEEEALKAQLDAIRTRQPPDAVGLDIPTKRSINFMILAFAQQLFIQFDDDDLVFLVKEAGQKSVGAVNYGSEGECELILKRIRIAMESMDEATDFASILQKRAKLLSDGALFRDDTDAVPAAGTVATLYRIDANGLVRQSDANLLGENYWDVVNVLSR